MSSCTSWRRLEERWDGMQVGRQGSYSVERLESFDHYCKVASSTRVLLVCVLTPLPALLTSVLLETLPLESPSKSWTANWVFWVRFALSNVVMIFAGLSQLVVLVPELNPTLFKRAVVCVGATSAYVATAVLGVNLVGFPFPLTWYIGGFFEALYIPMMIVIVFGRSNFVRSSPCRPNLLRFFHYFQAFIALFNIFPLCKVLYGLLPVSCRWLVIVVMPVWRFAAKRFMVHEIAAREDFIPGIVAMTVDFFSSLFISVCMSTTGSLYLSALFIAADMLQSLLEFREMRTKANAVVAQLCELKAKSSTAGSLIQHSDNFNLAAVILVVTRDPKAFHITSLEHVRLNACYPHAVAKEQSEKLLALQASGIYDKSDASMPLVAKRSARLPQWPHRRTQVQSLAIVPKPAVPDVGLLGNEANGPSPATLFCPRCCCIQCAVEEISSARSAALILVEYVECIVPFMYVLSKTVLEYLPNVRYYPDGAGHFGPAATVNILVFATLEVVTLLLFHAFLQRKFAFSPLYQLAFVLETQVYIVQAQLFLESIYLLQYELGHYGKLKTAIHTHKRN